MSRNQELRDLSKEELEARFFDVRQKLFHLVNERQQSRQQFEKPHRIREAKREIARILTIQRENELANQGRGN